jgi:uncharacterized membrane protein YqjE
VGEPRPQPGLTQVLLVALVVVGVVLGAVVLTSLLPSDVQRVIFDAPVLIVVLIVGTAVMLWRVARGRASDPPG